MKRTRRLKFALSSSASDNQHCVPPHTVYVSPSMSLIAKDTAIEADQTQAFSTTENCTDQNQTLLPNVSVEVAVENKEDLAVSPIAIDIPSPTVLDGSSCCRICMETVTEEDFAKKSALRLGCKCRDGMDIVHLKCAKKWFRLKRSPDCEICGAPANGLPEPLQKELNVLKEERSHVYFQLGEEDLIDPQDQHPPVPRWIFIACCVLPALFSAGILILYLHWCLQTELASAIVLSTALAVITLIHWLTAPYNYTWNVLFAVIHLCSIVFATALFHYYYEWYSISSTIGGCLIGSVTSVGIYSAFRTFHVICSAAAHQWGSNALVLISTM